MANQSIEDRYFRLLKSYVMEPKEEHLAAAVELGRELVTANVPEEDVTEIHERAVLLLAQESPEMTLRHVAHLISGPLMEMFLAYGLAFRERIEERKQEEEELKAANQQLTAGEQQLRAANQQLDASNQQLRASETQKQAILDGITTNIALVNDNLEILWANKCAADSVGKKPEEMIGHKCHEFWADPEKPCENCPTLKAFKTGKTEHSIMRTPDDRVWHESGEPVFDQDGKIIGVVEIAHDITERMRAEEELRESQKKLTDIFKAAEDVSFILTDVEGKDSRIIEFSPGAEKIFGYSHEEVTGKPVAMLHLREDAEKIPEVLKAMSEDKKGFSGESVLVRKNGEKFPALFTTYPIFNDDGKMTGAVGVSIDITERKMAEEELAKYREHLEELVEERTGELKKSEENLKEKIKELEIFHDAAVDRELKMEELRVEIEKLKTQIDTDRNTNTHRSP